MRFCCSHCTAPPSSISSFMVSFPLSFVVSVVIFFIMCCHRLCSFFLPPNVYPSFHCYWRLFSESLPAASRSSSSQAGGFVGLLLIGLSIPSNNSISSIFVGTDRCQIKSSFSPVAFCSSYRHVEVHLFNNFSFLQSILGYRKTS